jgi:hypothetical protein
MTETMQTDANKATETPPPKKQALILVHGMGEQVPMETLKGFVDTMWIHDTDIDARGDRDPPAQGNPIWWKPDPSTGSYELSRITTREGHQGTRIGPRTDFFEFYWADLTEVNTLAQLKDWLMSLLWRRWSQVPKDVFSVWIILWLLTLSVGGLAIWHALAVAFGSTTPRWANIAFSVLALLYAVALPVVLGTFGDVAHYVRAKPANIAARQAIRDRGLALLRAITAKGEYSHIVLVGHSLGSIIAYDLLKLYWSECGAPRTMQRGDALYEACVACDTAGGLLADPAYLENYRAAQHRVFDAMQAVHAGEKAPWLISDFVTLGSPLAHAQFLLAQDQDQLDRGQKDRRFPVCPPVSEGADGFLYRPDRRNHSDLWSMHHAAPFAAVRWTNIYDPSHGIIFGDMIGGSVTNPAGANFGPGITDIPVTIRRAWARPFDRFFTHTLYWTETTKPSPQLEPLRKALDLA